MHLEHLRDSLTNALRQSLKLATLALVVIAFAMSAHAQTTTGVVRGIVVRSRNVFATLGAAFQQLAGGNITIWTRMCEETRRDAFEIMIQHASEIGANAIVGTRYDTTEISTGVTEVLAYGTAVIVEPVDSGYRS